jgi:hypothetical protein
MGFMMRLLDGKGCSMEVLYFNNKAGEDVVDVGTDELRASEPKTSESFVACGEF